MERLKFLLVTIILLLGLIVAAYANGPTPTATPTPFSKPKNERERIQQKVTMEDHCRKNSIPMNRCSLNSPFRDVSAQSSSSAQTHETNSTASQASTMTTPPATVRTQGVKATSSTLPKVIILQDDELKGTRRLEVED